MEQSRTYVESYTNGVYAITTLSDDEIRYSVVKNGVLLYNRAMEGTYRERTAGMLAREQDRAAKRAEAEA